MAFKLTKAEGEQRTELVEKLGKAVAQLEDDVREYNEKVGELRAPVEAALAAYNALVEEARGFCEDIVNERETDYDGKSEKWQEGDKGEAARSWIDEWQNVDLSELEIEFPDDLEVDAPTHADDLQNLPEEADQ